MEAEERRKPRRGVELGRSAPRRTHGAVGGPPRPDGVEGGDAGYFGNPGAVVRTYGTDAGYFSIVDPHRPVREPVAHVPEPLRTRLTVDDSGYDGQPWWRRMFAGGPAHGPHERPQPIADYVETLQDSVAEEKEKEARRRAMWYYLNRMLALVFVGFVVVVVIAIMWARDDEARSRSSSSSSRTASGADDDGAVAGSYSYSYATFADDDDVYGGGSYSYDARPSYDDDDGGTPLRFSYEFVTTDDAAIGLGDADAGGPIARRLRKRAPPTQRAGAAGRRDVNRAESASVAPLPSASNASPSGEARATRTAAFKSSPPSEARGTPTATPPSNPDARTGDRRRWQRQRRRKGRQR